MNKNLKRIIAIILAVNTVSTIAPAANLGLLTTKAYAANKITNLTVEDSNGDNMSLYSESDCTDKHRVDSDDVQPGKTYYTRKTSADEINIDADGVDSDNIRVFEETSSDTEGKDIGEDVDLSSGTNVITVRVYNGDPGTVKYSDNSYVNEYKIRVKYSESNDDDDEDSDNVYLSSITLMGGNIDFSKKVYTYDVQVPEDLSKITIRARPDCDSGKYDDYKVKINGVKVDKDDKFKDDVSLNKGKNVIDIKVEDDDDNERVYTLNITRGKDNSNNNSKSSEQAEVTKTSQWVQVDGKWQYKDSTGNSVKNTWVQNYFVQADGNMATGWLNNNGKWYYLGDDGARKTGWQLVNGNWYYLDSQGTMQVGWIRDINNGKYYYLNNDGSMAYNTTIGEYKLGSDGAWYNR
ncbi:N-acetylmuramoyl-L-alanine amidase family protein [Clostridium beijerinckii]|uniref:N-acetylmuramoyl-L-alanine amidase family protein n=1 Tax=Clostridium beijerinckii TaxID=1520 RepID=UPI00136115C9|nr:cadherin-like beta sandwich domain-containing protein [Clostridium beijerinckii]MZK53453.1 cell wall-binding protein [Clostridium beijerinckii]MZK61591.1 cell wall-binding protein [Clostridium beijerinckii]MZK71877.1 cell wall-binding protein [Clostridium beijerinckii]MZK77220.1 cell wall-binding protein [Clostridium beijerinckii]MZK86848.1 cell wall-binding protein [Clostridium beijerinckii]